MLDAGSSLHTPKPLNFGGVKELEIVPQCSLAYGSVRVSRRNSKH